MNIVYPQPVLGVNVNVNVLLLINTCELNMANEWHFIQKLINAVHSISIQEMLSTLAKNGVIETPLDTSVAIHYWSKKGATKTANIIKMGEKYVAVFDEDDVDFAIRITNRNDERDFRYHLTVSNENYRYIVPSGRVSTLKTAESHGRHFHFVSEASKDGKVLLNEMATKFSISPKCSADLMSIIKFDVDYSLKFCKIFVVDVTSKTLAICMRRSIRSKRKLSKRTVFQRINNALILVARS